LSPSKPVLPLAPRVRLRIFFHGRTPRLIGERVGAQLKTNHLRQCVPASLEVEYCPGRCRGPDLAPLRAAVRVVDPTGRAVAAGTPEACPSGIRHVGGADGMRCASVSRKAGSHWTPRWREQDSNPRSPLGEVREYEISCQDREIASTPTAAWRGLVRPVHQLPGRSAILRSLTAG